MYKLITIILLAALTGCVTTEPRYYTQQEVKRMIEQQRDRDLILQHGAGGCTPNFSTGGCL